MRQLMKTFQHVNEKPRVLGLTATLLNGNCRPHEVMKMVEKLETTYHSKVATVDELKDVLGYILFFFLNKLYETIINRTFAINYET